MAISNTVSAALARFPRVAAAHTPTPLEPLSNLGGDLGLSLYVKRDDCTGVAFGGNKIRQLEFYIGAALAAQADTIVITGAIQSNFVRAAAAMARRYNMQCHIQLEERVPDVSALYRENGNVLLDRLLGATLHSFPEGENEAASDAALEGIADRLRSQGRRPYVIALGADHPPLGALGYVAAAVELATQLKTIEPLDEIVIASGSALTHAGLLLGLRALGLDIPVRGVCVRRDAKTQTKRAVQRVDDLAGLMDLSITFRESDFVLFDGTLGPGYGQLDEATKDAIGLTARREGLFLDPVYTGKTMAAVIQLARSSRLKGRRILFWHTGGQPALFGYADQLHS